MTTRSSVHMIAGRGGNILAAVRERLAKLAGEDKTLEQTGSRQFVAERPNQRWVGAGR